MKSSKVIGLAAAVALVAAAPAFGGKAAPPVVAQALAAGTMQATTVHVRGGAMIVERFTLEPGSSFGWHRHGAPVAVVVAKGTLTVFDPTVGKCAPFHVSRGQSFVEPANHVHLARNDGKATATVYAVYLGVPKTAAANAVATTPAGCKA